MFFFFLCFGFVFLFSSFSLIFLMFVWFFLFFVSLFAFLVAIFHFFSFLGCSKIDFFFGLNCFPNSENISSKKKNVRRLGGFLPKRPLLFLKLFFFFSFFYSFKFVPLQIFVLGLNKSCFLRPWRCGVLTTQGRDSWDWVGPPTWERA